MGLFIKGADSVIARSVSDEAISDNQLFVGDRHARLQLARDDMASDSYRAVVANNAPANASSRRSVNHRGFIPSPLLQISMFIGALVPPDFGEAVRLGMIDQEGTAVLYWDAAKLFFELGDPDAAMAAVDGAIAITTKRHDFADQVALFVLRGDCFMAIGEYRDAADSYGEAIRIGRSLADQSHMSIPYDVLIAEQISVEIGRLGWTKQEPLGTKGVVAFKRLTVQYEHFRGLPHAEQIKVAKDIAEEWKVEKGADATEITATFIRAHYPTVSEGVALREEGEKMMEEGKYRAAEEKFRDAAQRFHAALLHAEEAESRRLQLEAIASKGGRTDINLRASVLNLELIALDNAIAEVGGLDKARLLEKKAYALVAAGRMVDAAAVISEAHHLNVRAGTGGAEANAEMHENFGNLALEHRQRLLAVDEFEIAARENFGLKRFSKAARLFGRSGDLLSSHKSRYGEAISYYDLAVDAATKARNSDLIQTYSYKKINILIAMDRFIEAAELADELLKRSVRSDNKKRALELRQGVVRLILRRHIVNPPVGDWRAETAWDVFSSLKKGDKAFSQLSERDQWNTVHTLMGEWERAGEAARKNDFADIADFAEQRYAAIKNGALAEGQEARGMERDGRDKENGKDGAERARGGIEGAEGRPPAK